MKKLLYPVIGFAILCLSFFTTGKKTEEKRIEEQNSDNLILRPFQLFGLLWSCSPEHSDVEDIQLQDPTHYSELVDSVSNSGTHSSHYSGTHYSHSSQNHSSHYSGTHLPIIPAHTIHIIIIHPITRVRTLLIILALINLTNLTRLIVLTIQHVNYYV